MSDDSDSEPISRRAFLQRIRRGGFSSVDEQSGERDEEGVEKERSGSGSAGRHGGAGISAREARRALEELGVTILPLSAEDDLLQVQCKRAGEEFGPEAMRLLAPLSDRIAWLDLASTAIDDEALELVSEMRALRRLYLQNTAITGPALGHLRGLTNLEYLNLFGTGVDNKSLHHLGAVESLRTLYLWQTNVTEEGVEHLRERRPDMSVEFGGASFDT